jgi:hypothetical protein
MRNAAPLISPETGPLIGKRCYGRCTDPSARAAHELQGLLQLQGILSSCGRFAARHIHRYRAGRELMVWADTSIKCLYVQLGLDR